MASFILIKTFPQLLSTLDFLVGKETSNFLRFDCLQGIRLATPFDNILNNEGLLVGEVRNVFGVFGLTGKFSNSLNW